MDTTKKSALVCTISKNPNKMSLDGTETRFQVAGKFECNESNYRTCSDRIRHCLSHPPCPLVGEHPPKPADELQCEHEQHQWGQSEEQPPPATEHTTTADFRIGNARVSIRHAGTTELPCRTSYPKEHSRSLHFTDVAACCLPTVTSRRSRELIEELWRFKKVLTAVVVIRWISSADFGSSGCVRNYRFLTSLVIDADFN